MVLTIILAAGALGCFLRVAYMLGQRRPKS
jgi:hypothetical protein